MVNEQLAEGDWCTTEELSTLVTSARATAAGRGQIAQAPSSLGMPSDNPGPLRAPLPATEVICDSHTDLSDGQLEAAIALAFRPVVDHEPEGALPDHGSDAQPSAGFAAPEELSIMDPRAAGGRRLAAHLAGEPCHAARAIVRHLRDAFNLPLRLVLALALIDSPTLRWIYEGRSIIATSHCPTHATRHWYALVDMVDPLAGQMATAMLTRNSLRETALLPATL